MKILVCEEYGYRYYLWTYPGSLDDLIADWKARRIPFRPIDEQIRTPEQPFRKPQPFAEANYRGHVQALGLEGIHYELGYTEEEYDAAVAQYYDRLDQLRLESEVDYHFHEKSDSRLRLKDGRSFDYEQDESPA